MDIFIFQWINQFLKNRRKVVPPVKTRQSPTLVITFKGGENSDQW
jgi:hypothetical protein